MDLERLNTLTKYPSIPTYHVMGERGRLTENRAYPTMGDSVLATEKVDGTNARIVLLDEEELSVDIGADWLIGSREEWLHARGDLIWRNDNGIVDALQDTAERLWNSEFSNVVIYGEVYGGKINAAKQYTVSGEFGFRIFDVVWLRDLIHATRDMTIPQISAWRESGGIVFEGWDGVERYASAAKLQMVPMVRMPWAELDVADAEDWLGLNSGATQVGLDAHGHSEGVVIRNASNKWRTKLRHEDYARTMRARGGK